MNTYGIKYNYNGKEETQGGFSLEAARSFAKKTARYAGKCEVTENGQTVETWAFSEEAGRVVQVPGGFMANKLIHSIEFARDLAARYAYAATTPEQKESVAQYMFEHDTAVLKAQSIVLGVEDTSSEKAKGMFTEVWLTR